MKNYVKHLQDKYVQSLAEAGQDYLRAGLKLFHTPQTAVGNLAIAVELMLKAFIAKKNLLLIFKRTPLELRVLLSCPLDLPKSFNWRTFDIDVNAAEYPLIEMGECVSIFFIFFPQMKQRLQSHLKILTRARNASVHSFLPSFQKYEVERAAYVALQIYIKLCEEKVYEFCFMRKKAEEFIKKFQDERLQRVQKAIEDAKKRAKNLKGRPHRVRGILNWDTEIIECPICGSDAILEGYTDIVEWETSQNIDGPELGLFFYPETFRCDECKLELHDVEELRLVGIPTEFDRSDLLEEFMQEEMRSEYPLDEEILW